MSVAAVRAVKREQSWTKFLADSSIIKRNHKHLLDNTNAAPKFPPQVDILRERKAAIGGGRDGNSEEFSSLHQALQTAHHMDLQGIPVSRDIIYGLLQACIKRKDVATGRHVRSLMVSSGLESIAPLGDQLIRLFASCGSLLEAKQAFHKVAKPSMFTWNAIISAHAKLGEGNTALQLYCQMQQDGIKPDKVTFLCALKACSSIQAIKQGRLVHHQTILSGLEFDVIIGNTLVDMYSKCDSIDEARHVFDKLLEQDAVSWGVMSTAYARHGHCHSALAFFEKMELQGITPSRVVFSCILKVCGSKGAIGQGRLIHGQIMKSNLNSDILVGSALVDMYAEWGCLDEARKMFDEQPDRNAQSWGEMIAGYAQHGHTHLALELVEKMQQEGIRPDKVAILRILKACSITRAIRQGRLVHDQIIKSELDSNVVVANTLVDMYAKCRSVQEASKVFIKLKNRDVVSWSAMIVGYAQHGYGLPALQLFQKMQEEGIEPSKVSFLGALKACSIIGDLSQGRLVHRKINSSGLVLHVAIGSALIDMYTKCGSLKEARTVFDSLPNRNVFSWCAMITGYAQYGLGVSALELFMKMQQEMISPDQGLFSSILKACSSIGAISHGRLIHDQIIHSGVESHLVIGNTLVDMYAKSGHLAEARKTFDNLPVHDVVSWGAMTVAYCLHGYALVALELFDRIRHEGTEPNRVIFLGLLKACGSIGAMKQGRMIHDEIVRRDLELDVVVGNTLLDMYARCGCLTEACKVFYGLSNPDEVSWSVIIAGYAWYGNCTLARQFLQAMQQQGLKPDDVTFMNVLTACSHAGLLEEGHWFFKCMREDYNIMPSIEHYSCMVDLLSRAGHLNDAEDLIQTMPVFPDLIVWMSLLTSCRTYGNMELARRCFHQAFQLDSNDASGYVLMSSVYADEHMWEDVGNLQELKKCAGAQKKRAMVWIEIHNKAYEFLVGETNYPQSTTIDTKSKGLSRCMKDGGYIPQVDLVLKLDEGQEDDLCGRPEDVGVVFGLLETSELATPQNTGIIENCMDSHHYGKASHYERQEIKVYDS